jgi:hypothetical protein
MIDCSCGRDRMPASRRYSSSVRMVFRERLTCAGSGILMVFVNRLMLRYSNSKFEF